jgi:anti-anti-sigma factor
LRVVPYEPVGFSIHTEVRGPGLLVVPRGELDIATAPELEQVVSPPVDAGGAVVIDLRELTFMDSTGVRLLVAAHARAGETGATLSVVAPEEGTAVARVLEVAGILEALDVVAAPPDR